MESIGDMLKKRRVERGMDLAATHEATKVTMQNLAALEEDRFDAFPNRVYARAFLRDYANFLGLDSSDMLKRYETEWCAPPPVPKQVRRTRPLALSLFLIFFVLVCGGGLAYYLVTQGSYHKPKVHKTVQKPPVIKEKPPVNVENPTPPSSDTIPPTAVQPPKPTPEKPVVPPGMVMVELQAVGQPVWIRVKRNGKLEIEETLPAGAKASFVGNNIWVRSGIPIALAVKVNGKSIGRFGPKAIAMNRLFLPEPAKPDSR